MDPTLVQNVLATLGLPGAIIVGGWYALKWLADRDDSRNTQLMQIVKEVTNAVTNNTQAMENMGRKSEMVAGELVKLERSIESRFPKRKR
jgi:hypothetical protein